MNKRYLRYKTVASATLPSLLGLTLCSTSSFALDFPGLIEAEDYTSHSGTVTEPTGDTGGGFNIGYIDAGDSLSYIIDVGNSGSYNFQVRVASPRTGSEIELKVNDQFVETMSVPTTGDWQVYQTIETQVTLNAGSQTIQLVFDGTSSRSLLNVNWLAAEYLGGADSTVVMQKQNTGFSIDGNNGAIEGQQVYLWNTNTDNVNQQWIELSQGNDFYSYQKKNTSLCLDGGSGAALRQPVTLEICSGTDQDQHWRKVNLSKGSFRLEKRNTNFSIDGNHGAEQLQDIYLWTSDNDNVNQQWQFIDAATIITPPPTDPEIPSDRSDWVLNSSNNAGDLQNAIDDASATRWTTRATQSNGQWLTIDLGATYAFNTIKLLSYDSPNDYPRAYQVFTSNDGESWGSAIASGNGSSASTNITFDETAARHIQIVQTGSHAQYWWSIHDLLISLDDGDTPDWNISSLSELRAALTQNNQDIVMRPGYYDMRDLPEGSRNFQLSGSNNTVNLDDVYVDVPVGSTEKASYFTVTGSNNIVIGGTFEDTYTNGLTQITDFVSYNEDSSLAYGLGGDAVMSISGDDNTIDGIKLTIRGSFPYGYGSIFGIGSGSSFGLNKRCGIVITGDSNTIENAELQQRAFCHGIYMQPPADNTVIRNVLVEGAVRETNDMLNEGSGSLPDQADYLDVDGNPILANEMNSLSEDGIRSYSNSGSVIVENSVVKKMRGGIRLYLASSATVSNSTAIDCGATNFNMPNGGTVTNSTGNFTYGVLNDFRLSRSNQDLDITILPSPNAVGSHNIADILGNNHDIVFRRAGGPEDTDETRVIKVYGNNSTIRNETEYKIVLEPGSSGNNIISAGEVIDNGSNTVSHINLSL